MRLVLLSDFKDTVNPVNIIWKDLMVGCGTKNRDESCVGCPHRVDTPADNFVTPEYRTEKEKFAFTKRCQRKYSVLTTSFPLNEFKHQVSLN